MKAVYEVKENSTAELTVTVDGEKWSNALAKAYKKLAANVEIKGFRKGKAPEVRIRQVLGQQIQYEAVDLIAQEALTYGLEENKDVVLEDRPTLEVLSVDENSTVLKFVLTIKPEVKLGDYQNVYYNVEHKEVEDEEIEKHIEQLRQQHAEEVLKEDGEVEQGNIAVIDFEGFLDGVAFEGGKGTEYPLEIGSHSFIEGFEEQLIGMKTGEEKDIEVTFPENYTAELAGKKATFHVKVDGIKEKHLPEVNDEFVADLEMGEEVKTVEDLKKNLKENLQKEADSQADRKAEDEFLDKLCEVCTVEVPEVMIKRKNDELFEEQSYSLLQNGISMDSFLKMMGQTAEEYKERLKPQSEQRVKIKLILEAIGKDMKIEVTDEEVEAEYESVAKMYQMDVERVKQLIGKEDIVDTVLVDKTFDTIKNRKAE
ncbi:MAG: trigger factor [Erysipelotrichia bacterium]|nr:trigger factor [Erysipelotrichia bacterium]